MREASRFGIPLARRYIGRSSRCTSAARAVILVYDVTDPNSFASLVHWHAVVPDTLPIGTPLYVAANKIDLAEQMGVNEPQARRFAAAHQAQFFRVSAITGEGLDILFEAIAGRMADGNELVSYPGKPRLTPRRQRPPANVEINDLGVNRRQMSDGRVSGAL